MNFTEATIEGSLLKDGQKIPVQVMYASKYSLMVKFPEGQDYADQTEFDSLVLDFNPETFEFGRCSLLLEANINDFAGRIVFMEDFHNFDILFMKKVNVNLQTFFYNLPLILNHKNNIRQSFKDYTGNLSYDLSVYKQYFDSIDAEIKDEPDMIRDAVQKVIIENEGRKFMNFFSTKLDELEGELKDFSREEHERHGFYFRKQVWNFILCSEFMTRTNLKPRGYAGDSDMMRMIYENGYWGTSTFAKLMHKHPIEHAAAEAVRNRRLLVPTVLREVQKDFSGLPPRGFRILSVACGPAYELTDILLNSDDFNSFSFSLLDQDRSALMEAAKNIEKIEKIQKHKTKVVYLKDSVRTMLGTPQISEKWGQFHYIYSMGLFDYLTPPVAAAVLKKVYEMLLPGGQILIGNFHVNNPSKFYMEYWCDWVLYYRTEEDLLNLLDDSTAEKKVLFEDSGSQMFLQIKKKG